MPIAGSAERTAGSAAAVSTQTRPAPVARIDPRGTRFAAAVTSVVLAVTLLTGSGWLLLVQAVLFAAAAFGGLRFSLWGLVFRRFIRPRLGAPTETEAETPPRFAQGVGLVFAVIGTVGYLAGAPVVGAIATGFALVAALLNATVGLCLGCEMYLSYKRITTQQGAHA